MPLCTSTPRGLLDCSGGMGHTWGALSLQDTWQENAHTEKEEEPTSQRAARDAELLGTSFHPHTSGPVQQRTMGNNSLKGFRVHAQHVSWRPHEEGLAFTPHRPSQPASQPIRRLKTPSKNVSKRQCTASVYLEQWRF